jgi:fibronectin-binding autotransporter adhesin
MKKNWYRLALASVVVLAPSIDAYAIDYKWNVLGGGAQTWQTAANWTPNTAFPNSVQDFADLAVPLTGPLTVDIGATNVKVGRLDIGSTGSAVLTDITGTTPNTFLQFRNVDDANFNDDANGVDGTDFLIWQQGLGAGPGATNGQGDANGDGFVNADDLRIWRTFMTGSGGAGLINSVGVAGATNRISATVLAGDEAGIELVDVRGTNSLDLSGGFRVLGADNELNSFLPAGAVLTVSNINTEDQADDTTNRRTFVNRTATAGGRVEIGGVTGGGELQVGAPFGNSAVSTIVLNTANPGFSGTFRMNRSTVIVGDDQSLGTGSFALGGPSGWTGFNIASSDDARNIALRLNLAQYPTFTGEHSFTLSGVVYQSNSRGLINILPAGEALTISSDVYAMSDMADTERTMILDGSGKTIITGTLKQGRFDTTLNMEATEPVAPSGITASFTKRGTGELQINGAALYTGVTRIDGGNLTFAAWDGSISTSSILVTAGAVGANAYSSFSTPDTMQTNFSFLTKVDPTSTGGLVIDEAAGTYDFGGAMAVVPLVSLAAPVGGLTFTGSIVPAVLDPTYRLGGGAGTLTLPAAQLTGANNLVVTNGGTVVLGGANSYSGTTSIVGKVVTTFAGVAAVNQSTTNNNGSTTQVISTTLSVNNLQNGGLNSSIGSSTNLATNLVIQGATLRYTGAGASTDRLFTIAQVSGGTNALAGSAGATIESSGTGALNFTNTGAVAVTGTIATSLTLGGTNTDGNTLRPNVTNGADPAAVVRVIKADAGKWVLTGTNSYTGTTAVNGGTLLVNGSHTGGGAYTVAAGATLGGAGSIAANITSTGIVSPGNNAATAGPLAVTGNVTMNAGSTTLIEIGGTTAGQFDELNINGSLAAGGTFDVDLISGFTPVIGNSFDVLDFLSASGAFTLSLPALPAGRAWNTSQLLNTGTISVVAGIVGVPEPSSLVMGAGMLALAAMRRRRSA